MLLSHVTEQDGACAGNHQRGRPLLHFYIEVPFCLPEMVQLLLTYGENVNLISHGNPAIPSTRADLDLQIRTSIQQSQSLKPSQKSNIAKHTLFDKDLTRVKRVQYHRF
jgi:hypothetical protein